MSKPIRVFWSPLSQRFYATRSYREDPRGFVTVTGEQFDVTDDIARLILHHEITFPAPPASPVPEKEGRTP